ncbi:uncharacterized protein LOC119672842 isoform X2 [Teleopsis dalmanni]|nr:uncharacterized protein LOC119672842 isoform X2 [Teleopsis dalmanni]XP_037939920.1 uncharacterized protein LOC119672842 isoform X2 [Teleopsis dalmanni]XP_037939921.1 uncharacterized protein LOC119672842 isoform X2 [Teleopsis dalmanni]
MLKQQHRPAFCPLCRGYFQSTADGFVALKNVQSYEEQIAEEYFFDDGEITPDDEEFIESEDDYVSGGESEQSYIFSNDEFLDEEAEFSPVEDIFDNEQ